MYAFRELDGAKVDGIYAGNRLKKYWQRATQKEGDNTTQKEDIIGNKTGNENGENAIQKEDRSGKWLLPGLGFFVRMP